MNKLTPLTDADGEVRELTAADLRSFKPASEVLSPALQKTLGLRSRGPQKTPTKVSTTIRLSDDVVQAFRSTGDGWQTRIDAALKDWLKTHSPA
ncbi:MAG: BrnA antitoxin family protein [Rhodoferax sp.]